MRARGSAILIHIDLDCFFVSCERVRHPHLQGRAVVVCNRSDEAIFGHTPLGQSSVESGRGAFAPTLIYDKFAGKGFEALFRDQNGRLQGIVVAKSYEAKARGIQTGTPLAEAMLLVPDLIALPQSYTYYHALSKELAEFLQSRIPAIEQFSIDEFFGDISGWVEPSETLAFIADLQAEIQTRFGLPVSIAASEAKWIAKLATDEIKPYGVRVIRQAEIFEFVEHLPIESFCGVGPQVAAKIRTRGITTLGQLWHAPHVLASMGKNGAQLFKRLRGEDREGVSPKAMRQSVGIGRNFAPLEDRAELLRRVVVLSRHLAYTLFRLELSPRLLGLQLRYQGGERAAQSIPLDRLFSEQLLKELSVALFKRADHHPRWPVGYLGISLSRFAQSQPFAPSLIDYEGDRKRAELNHKQGHLRQKYGIDVLRWGVELSLL